MTKRVGALLRVLRLRRGLRQIDIAVLVGVSDATVSRIERGHLVQLSLAAIRRVVRVLEASVELTVWTRFGDVERVSSSRHASLVNDLIAAMTLAGWTCRPEVSFSVGGERGFIDILAWHPKSRTVLVIEVKTEVVHVAETLGTLDRKQRLVPSIARRLGWDPERVASALVLGDTRTNHRRLTEHAATFGASLPHGGQRFRAFVRRPVGSLAAVAFWPIRHPGSARHLATGSRRVRRPDRPSGRAIVRSGRGRDADAAGTSRRSDERPSA